ncbi:hypothetical protein CLV84_1705 [Neolewinella xylanilytica]|uniref:Uncharacterized protein n=1 Tax=Neolewinella xylanilytica TaxID=1514080 RepID=A0A2S6IB50_9BACT|nr:hypothetical protein [Neolewinella xylanilytica]PPK88734.1 hypothetical protein CLV84_1705 [Neolewinella xylanilytica]
MKNYLLALGIFYSAFSFAQEISIPNVTYRSAADYTAQNEKVVEVIDHLRRFPADVYESRRKEAVSYLVKWLSGTPDVTVELLPFTMPYLKYGESMAIFMGSYAKLDLQDTEADEYNKNLTALRSVAEYYLDNIDVFGRDKQMDKLVKLEEKDKLAKLVTKELEKIEKERAKEAEAEVADVEKEQARK